MLGLSYLDVIIITSKVKWFVFYLNIILGQRNTSCDIFELLMVKSKLQYSVVICKCVCKLSINLASPYWFWQVFENI